MRRHIFASSSVFLVALVVFAGCSPETSEVTPSSEVGEGESAIGAGGLAFVPGEILIQYEPGATESQKLAARGLLGAGTKERIHTSTMKMNGVGELELAALPHGLAVAAAVSGLEGAPGVAFAEPNYIYQHAATSDDPSYSNGSLWGMYGDGSVPANAFGSQAAEAWASDHTGSSDVVVGIIDTGMDASHEDLVDNVWINPDDPVNGVDDDGNGFIDDVHGWDFLNDDSTVYDGIPGDGIDAHGTHVAGTIGARGGNGKGVAGVNWNVTILSAKFIGPSGGTTANAVKAVDYVTNLKLSKNMNIVATNNSWGGGGFSQSLLDAIERANAAGILFIAAAGNNGRNIDRSAFYPASYSADNVISVAAIDSSGNRASFSNFGRRNVDLGAPGVGVVSTVPGGYASFSGTSMATPHVTGAAALFVAADPANPPSAADLKQALLDATLPTSSLNKRCATGGRLDASGF